MTSREALLPMGSINNVKPNTFIALDLEKPVQNAQGVWGVLHNHVVGHFVGWDKGRLVLSLPDDAAVLLIPLNTIIKGYWAPMGYRPERV